MGGAPAPAPIVAAIPGVDAFSNPLAGVRGQGPASASVRHGNSLSANNTGALDNGTTRLSPSTTAAIAVPLSLVAAGLLILAYLLASSRRRTRYGDDSGETDRGGEAMEKERMMNGRGQGHGHRKRSRWSLYRLGVLPNLRLKSNLTSDSNRGSSSIWTNLGLASSSTSSTSAVNANVNDSASSVWRDPFRVYSGAGVSLSQSQRDWADDVVTANEGYRQRQGNEMEHDEMGQGGDRERTNGNGNGSGNGTVKGYVVYRSPSEAGTRLGGAGDSGKGAESDGIRASYLSVQTHIGDERNRDRSSVLSVQRTITNASSIHQPAIISQAHLAQRSAPRVMIPGREGTVRRQAHIDESHDVHGHGHGHDRNGYSNDNDHVQYARSFIHGERCSSSRDNHFDPYAAPPSRRSANGDKACEPDLDGEPCSCENDAQGGTGTGLSRSNRVRQLTQPRLTSRRLTSRLSVASAPVRPSDHEYTPSCARSTRSAPLNRPKQSLVIKRRAERGMVDRRNDKVENDDHDNHHGHLDQDQDRSDHIRDRDHLETQSISLSTAIPPSLLSAPLLDARSACSARERLDNSRIPTCPSPLTSRNLATATAALRLSSGSDEGTAVESHIQSQSQIHARTATSRRSMIAPPSLSPLSERSFITFERPPSLNLALRGGSDIRGTSTSTGVREIEDQYEYAYPARSRVHSASSDAHEPGRTQPNSSYRGQGSSRAPPSAHSQSELNLPSEMRRRHSPTLPSSHPFNDPGSVTLDGGLRPPPRAKGAPLRRSISGTTRVSESSAGKTDRSGMTLPWGFDGQGGQERGRGPAQEQEQEERSRSVRAEREQSASFTTARSRITEREDVDARFGSFADHNASQPIVGRLGMGRMIREQTRKGEAWERDVLSAHSMV